MIWQPYFHKRTFTPINYLLNTWYEFHLSRVAPCECVCTFVLILFGIWNWFCVWICFESYLYLLMPLTALMQSDECSSIHRRRDVLSKRLEPLDRIVFCNGKKTQFIKLLSIWKWFVGYACIFFVAVEIGFLTRARIDNINKCSRQRFNAFGVAWKWLMKSYRRPPGFFLLSMVKNQQRCIYTRTFIRTQTHTER